MAYPLTLTNSGEQDTTYHLLAVPDAEVSMYVSVVVHAMAGYSGCPLAYATYKTYRHPIELCATS